MESRSSPVLWINGESSLVNHDHTHGTNINKWSIFNLIILFFKLKQKCNLGFQLLRSIPPIRPSTQFRHVHHHPASIPPPCRPIEPRRHAWISPLLQCWALKTSYTLGIQQSCLSALNTCLKILKSKPL